MTVSIACASSTRRTGRAAGTVAAGARSLRDTTVRLGRVEEIGDDLR
ncbi:hypothetical protein [Rubrobacter marinus]|nr:hypothetical protein [Rubrobacter marinus]